MRYQNKRPESPKGRVFTAFAREGIQAALDLAEELDISKANVDRWINKEWADEPRTGRKDGQPYLKRVARIRKGEAYVPAQNDRVVLSYDDDNSFGPGTVKAAGPEASVIRFDDRVERNISNLFLVPTKR